MVKVTLLNNQEMYINPHQIEYIENKPDTTITMLSGKYIIVREPYKVLFSRIVKYRRLIGAFKNEE